MNKETFGRQARRVLREWHEAGGSENALLNIMAARMGDVAETAHQQGRIEERGEIFYHYTQNRSSVNAKKAAAIKTGDYSKI